MKTNGELHFHQLSRMSASAAHYEYWLGHEWKQTKPQLLGDALDALLFGHKEVLVFEGETRRGKKWEEFKDSNPEEVLVVEKEYDIVQGMLASLKNHHEAMTLLEGRAQHTIYWKLGERACGGTPDVYARRKVVELKSTRTSHPQKFPYDARKFGYNAQLAWYHNALRILELIDRDAQCSIVAVESSPPYPVTIFDLTQRSYEQGERMWRAWFEQLLVCESSKRFPAYSDARVPLDGIEEDGITLKIGGVDVTVGGDEEG